MAASHLQTTIGDFIIRRADGLFAYQLAAVVDDAYQHVTEIARGADLPHSTVRQTWLQNCLGLVTPEYIHIPVAAGLDGKKLGKSSGSDPLNLNAPAETLKRVLVFQGHEAPRLSLAATRDSALNHWSLNHVPRFQVLPGLQTCPDSLKTQ